MELNTAVKPWMFAHLKALGYRHVVYLDPDILVMDRLADVERLLDEGATGVLLPHLTAPIDDGRHPARARHHAVRNLQPGFLALGRYTAAVGPFIDWVAEQARIRRCFRHRTRALHGSKVDGPRAGACSKASPSCEIRDTTSRHRNLSQQARRAVLKTDGRPRADRCASFTSSGFNPQNPKAVLQASRTVSTSTRLEPARELALEYAARVLGHGHASFRLDAAIWFGFFDEEHAPIPDEIRALYRRTPAFRKRAG